MRHLFSFALKAAVSCLLLYFAFAHVNFNVIGQRLNKVNTLWLAAAIATLLVQTMFGALRWQQIVQKCNPPDRPAFKVSRALSYNFIATFFNQALPSTVGGDAVRMWLLARDQGDWRIAAYSALIDRLAGVLVLAVLVILCLPWSFALITNANGRIALLIIGFGSIGACLMFLAVGRIRWQWLDRWWLTRELAATAFVAAGMFSSGSNGLLAIIYSVLIQALTATAAWCAAKAVAIPLDWSQALLLVLPVLLVATIPLSIAGWGTRETAMVLAFGYAGLSESNGLIVSVLLGIAMFAAGLVGGAVWILERSKRQTLTFQELRK